MFGQTFKLRLKTILVCSNYILKLYNTTPGSLKSILLVWALFGSYRGLIQANRGEKFDYRSHIPIMARNKVNY